jgi:hypothetical protein
MTYDWKPWAARHGPEVTRPAIDKVVAALRAEGVTTFGAIGYCFGGKWAMVLAQENLTKAIVLNQYVHEFSHQPFGVDADRRMRSVRLSSKSQPTLRCARSDWTRITQLTSLADPESAIKQPHPHQ